MKPRPLAGRVVLVTRPRPSSSKLAEPLRELGAEVIEAPTIELGAPEPGGELDDAIRGVAAGRYAWVTFTSTAGVAAWADRASALGVRRVPARLAAVGTATAEALRNLVGEPDLVPAEFTTSSLASAFPPGHGSVLLPRADLATEELEEALRLKGWSPVRVDAYGVSLAESLPPEAIRALDEERVDAVTFTSPSTVDGFVRLAGAHKDPAVVCIGPVTAEAARRAGLVVAGVAEPHTTDGLVRAVLGALDRTDR
jgi:uroporphyrinogen-III synthase